MISSMIVNDIKDQIKNKTSGTDQNSIKYSLTRKEIKLRKGHMK